MRHHFCYIIGQCLITLLLCTTCRNHIDHVNYATMQKEHTLLIYMIGDNSLSLYVGRNLYAINSGLKSCNAPLNVVIYRDNNSAGNDTPVLYQLKRRADSDKVDTTFIKRWDEERNSADPEQIAQVVRMTFERFDSDIKGMEIWSHALSWIPSNTFSADETETRATQYVGIDEQNYCELWQLREALEESDVHLDYMAFDACHMATAEVGYELRDRCDYILAAPTEVMGDGFPYTKMIESLSAIRDKETLLPGLTAAFEDFQETYANNGTLALLRTEGFSALYEACLTLEGALADGLAAWRENPSMYESKLQRYGRRGNQSPLNRYYFYDVQDWADQLSTFDSGSGNHSSLVADALAGCVVRSYHSARFSASGLETLALNRSCGLAMSIPQFWTLANNPNMDAAYSYIQWNLKVP